MSILNYFFGDFYVIISSKIKTNIRGFIMKTNEKIKELRLKNNLTQKEMANKLDISVSSLQKYEYGDFYPSAEVIGKIVDFFGITLNDFLDTDDITNEEKKIIRWNIERLKKETDKECEEYIEENMRNIEILTENKTIDDYRHVLEFMFMNRIFFDVNEVKKEVDISFYNDLEFINGKGVYHAILTFSELKAFLSYINETMRLNIFSALMLKSKKE